MKPFRCGSCGSLLAKTETDSKFEIKCGYCKMVNRFMLGTNFTDDRQMTELDWERSEMKRIMRKKKRAEV